MSRKELYPPIEPFDSGYLAVGDGHEIYYEQCGNPRGKTAVFVHGGPGAGGDANARRFFDPAGYRIVVFDQRGAGRSLPHASLVANTTWHLVADMELLRRHLNIERWLVFGGSWGSTLALAYAETHPAVVTELVLRGIFLLRNAELQWFYQHGASMVFPELWQEFLAPIPPPERHDLLAAYHRRLTHTDTATQLAAARAWSIWEGATSSLWPNPMRTAQFGAAQFALALARIEAHYFVNRGFFADENHLLTGAEAIRGIPGVIVQGRYDMVCPIDTAFRLHGCWPEADLRVVIDAGHSAYEPGITAELVTATDRFLRGAKVQ
ncbi:MAG: prolyl aminopeptidase [Gammaproteobacteria bacterium]